MDIKLLDCTLRDGGYVNNWNFGLECSRSVIQKLIYASVEIIEVGFLDERVSYDKDKTIVPNMECYNEMFTGIRKNNSKLFAMIDYGTFDIDNVIDKSDCIIDGIRVIFTQDKIEDAINYCSKLKEKGYIVFANAVNITNYSNDDFDRLFNCINNSNIDGAAIVDTYGLLTPQETLEYYEKFDNNLNSNMVICFHAHNTLQLAMGNCIHLLNNLNLDRETIIDSSLSGMGKGAGNAYTEILVRYLNAKGCRYGVSYILEILENEMNQICQKYSWNYSVCRYLSSINNVYYKYTDYYSKIKNLSYSEIVNIENLIKDEDRYIFSDNLALKYYQMYSDLKYKCVIFDIDGTLLDTTEGVMSAVDYTIKTCDFKELDYTTKLTFIGPPVQDSFKKTYHLDEEKTQEVAAIFRKRYKENDLYKAKVYEGIIELLEALTLKGIKIGIATYKREDYTMNILKYFDIDKYCDSIHGSDFEGKLTKYDIIKNVLNDLNCNSAVMIGDCPNDYSSAKDNNIDFIGVTYGFGFKVGMQTDFTLVDSVHELKKKLI